MNEQIRYFLAALLSLGLAASFSIAASAQDIVEETYTVEESDPPEVVVEDYVDDPEVVLADRDGMDRCAETFRSFDPDTGTYVTYGGETVRCPYLE